MEMLFKVVVVAIVTSPFLALFVAVLFAAIAEHGHKHTDPCYDAGEAIVYEMGFSVLLLACICLGADLVSGKMPYVNDYMIGAGVLASYALSFYLVHQLCAWLGKFFPNLHQHHLYS